jgi:hypothetical protein
VVNLRLLKETYQGPDNWEWKPKLESDQPHFTKFEPKGYFIQFSLRALDTKELLRNARGNGADSIAPICMLGEQYSLHCTDYRGGDSLSPVGLRKIRSGDSKVFKCGYAPEPGLPVFVFDPIEICLSTPFLI